MGDRVTVTKEELRERGIPCPINRGWVPEFYEEDGRLYCKRSHKANWELLVLCLGPHPQMPTRGVRIYWDGVNSHYE